ncbi:AIR synthase family protein [Hathewaya histolytica]|uniref:Hydrogenase maturation factor n=2 Tax=Hathewaya histolytica TaxID=1498 RepID=A0A4U9R2G0_HATHI|nr:hydrogenase maturation factor [Hathewaya histolytica]
MMKEGIKMECGKLNWDELQHIINNYTGSKREEVKVAGGIGEDCSIINFGNYDCVVSTDPITGASKGAGKLAVHINCNDIASSGVEPLGILVTILAPEYSKIEEILDIMKEIHEECKELNIQILGGHTEVTKAVNKIVVSVTAIGKGKAGKAIKTSGAMVGDKIIVTKELAQEGSLILAKDRETIVKKVLDDNEYKKVLDYEKKLSVLKEGKICGDFGVNAMHDITEGGVIGALWEVSNANSLGFKVYYENMPISNETMKLCKYFKIDPLKFISSGSMLISCKKEKELLEVLKENGISATIIGEVTGEKAILVRKGKEEEILPCPSDELFKII